MSKQDVERFLSLIRENKGLSEDLAQALNSGDIEALARESGLEFTEAEVREHLAATGSKVVKLSDGELAAATGGAGVPARFYAFCLDCNKCLHDGLKTPLGAMNISANHRREFPDHWVEIREE